MFAKGVATNRLRTAGLDSPELWRNECSLFKSSNVSILFGLTRTTIIYKRVNLHMQLNDRAICHHLGKDVTLWKLNVSSFTNVYTITFEWSSYALFHSIIKLVYYTFHGNVIPPVASVLKIGKEKGGKNSPVLTRVHASGKDKGLCLSICLNPKVIHALLMQ